MQGPYSPLLNAHRLFIQETTTISQLIDLWWDSNWGTLYVIVGIIYLPLIFSLQFLYRNQKPISLKYWRIIHNLAFCIFSAVGAIELTPTMINTWVYGGNFQNTVCQAFFHHQVESFWVFAFVISKLFELFESFYFIVEKKPLTFLHWYHHFVTYTFSCHALVMRSPSALYFSYMNLVVHAVMYLYYTLATVNGKPPSWGIIVTLGQITQMFIGVSVCYVEVFYCEPVFE